MRKPVFGVSDKARLKPVSSATETSKKIKISPVLTLDMILSKKGITKLLISLRGCLMYIIQGTLTFFNCLKTYQGM